VGLRKKNPGVGGSPGKGRDRYEKSSMKWTENGGVDRMRKRGKGEKRHEKRADWKNRSPA